MAIRLEAVTKRTLQASFPNKQTNQQPHTKTTIRPEAITKRKLPKYFHQSVKFNLL
jgi:hypothetical protein